MTDVQAFAFGMSAGGILVLLGVACLLIAGRRKVPPKKEGHRGHVDPW